ncbi:CLUMA_CG007700, isoform A [Clunio marinus]|uniref:CLUMA_CG007700, isoform A n=1 Tax=Clunio marinus TaxID=568069 RepID=A0A1J1I6Y7_9DIPT|nr:CLUMA_CG007700, isoform A [Clunio marinus]
MSQIGRQLETPRPLKSSIKQQAMPLYQQQQSFEVNSIEDLIALIEAVANSLSQGDVSLDLFNKMFSSLSLHGPQLEIYSKEILDRCFIVYRNASQDDRLKISIRLNLLNLIELRANSWQLSDGLNTYYKQKAATNVEPDNDMNMLGTSPSINMGMTLIGQALAPGEIVKNSGKFAKPTKIPGKNYSKDEIIIRNADSGKVNPGAKERLVQITGPSEESINYAKLLIEDTIKRNASPIREASQEGSCSSLASSDDQQVTVLPRTRMAMQQHINVQLPMGNKLTRSNSHHNNSVFHSLSTNDASLGEYKYTVNVGNHSIKITGDSLELVKVAKLVLDDFFTQQEFLKSSEAMMLNAEAASSMIPLGHQLSSQSSPFIDSGVHLDLLARSSSNAVVQLSNEVEDDVFMQGSPNNSNDDVQVLTSSSSIDSSSSSNTTVVTEQINAPANGLSRSRRSHFSRKDSTPEMANKVKPDKDQIIVHTKKSLWWFYQNLPLCKGLPTNYDYIREKIPAIIRDKNSSSSSETSSSAVVRYSDAEKFLEKRTIVESSDDVIEVDDDD